jgi:hypothetical protein
MKNRPAVYSKNFPLGFERTKENCFVTLKSYRSMERKYFKLFKRYQRESQRANEKRQALELEIKRLENLVQGRDADGVLIPGKPLRQG